jgi:hypothetical protein
VPAPAAEIRELLGKADGAASEGDLMSARRAFVDAGVCASTYGMWRAAVRCYRRALEIDLVDRELVGRIVHISGKLPTGGDWVDYARVLDGNPGWAPFGCRTAQIILGDLGGVVTCQGVGAVLELMMARDDHVDAHPDGRFAAMPLAMAMVILRRAMWPALRDVAEPRSLGVTFAANRRVRLDELGDWQAAT